MGTMDKVDSALGWLLERGYGALVFCLVIMLMLFLFQRQVDNEQSRILAETVTKLDAVAKVVDSSTRTLDRVTDTQKRMDEIGTIPEMKRHGVFPPGGVSP